MTLPIGKNNYKGFLLLETLISAAIFSIVAVLVLNSFMRSIRAVDFSKDYFKAGLLLDEKIYEIHNLGAEVGSSSGEIEKFGKRWEWSLAAEELDEFLNKVKLEISWKNKEKSLSVLTYLYR